MSSLCFLSRRSLVLALILVAVLANHAQAFGRRSKGLNTTAAYDATPVSDDDIPDVHYLVDMIGKEIYNAIKSPKYKFYIYMTIGTLPNETNTIVVLSTICNILYGIFILAGFLFFERGPMLLFTLCTLWIGPAMVLILLGVIGASVAAFALYPIASVSVITMWFFLTSQIAQQLGRRLGLDSDGDGDVDWLDVLHYFGYRTKLGEAIGLQAVYKFCHHCNMDRFQELISRLDNIHKETQRNSVIISERLTQNDNPNDKNKNGSSNQHEKWA